jgi:hypothetical protein
VYAVQIGCSSMSVTARVQNQIDEPHSSNELTTPCGRTAWREYHVANPSWAERELRFPLTFGGTYCMHDERHDESALNRPVWSALTTGVRRSLTAGARAPFSPGVAPFGATADDSPKAFAALGAIVRGGASLWLASTSSGFTPASTASGKRRSSK